VKRVILGVTLGTLLTAGLVAYDINRVGADDECVEPVAAGEPSGDQMTWRVVGTGDSILGMALGRPSPGGALLTDDYWIHAEYGRNAYTAGLLNSHSHESIYDLVLARSQPRGFIIVEDNGLGVTDHGWRVLLERIVRDTPTDRKIIFILPVFHWLWRADLHNETTIRRRIMLEVAATRQNRQIIDWSKAVLGDRTMVTDGQHPSARGKIWLQRAIRCYTGISL
jgi:hypothetical protein